MRAKNYLPNFITFLNLLCGIASLFAAVNQKFSWAAELIILGLLFDNLDGRVARKLNITSEFGRELDSLADFVTFGVAPALLLYLKYFSGLGYLGAFTSGLVIACASLRLARFNILKSADYFVGVPVPVIGAIIALWVIAKTHLSAGWLALLSILLACLMISPFRYPSFKTSLRLRNLSVLGVLLLFVIVLLIKLGIDKFHLIIAEQIVLWAIILLVFPGWVRRDSCRNFTLFFLFCVAMYVLIILLKFSLLLYTPFFVYLFGGPILELWRGSERMARTSIPL